MQVVLNPKTTHSVVRLQVYPASGGVTTLVDRVSVHTDRSVINGSFEGGWTGWNAQPNTNFWVYDNAAVAHDESRYGATNTTTSSGGISQDVTTTIAPGAPAVASVWVRAQDAPSSDGTFCVWGLDGGALESSCRPYYVTATTWTKLEVTLNPTRMHTLVRIQFYPHTGTTLVDTVSLDR
jgi:hypothetical protein